MYLPKTLNFHCQYIVRRDTFRIILLITLLISGHDILSVLKGGLLLL